MGANMDMPFGSSLPGVKIQVHTFPMGGFMPVQSFQMNGGNHVEEEYSFESDGEEEENVSHLFSQLFGKKDKSKKKKKKMIQEKIIRERPDDIVLNVKVSLKDILKNEKKTIQYERMRKKDGEYKMRKRKIDIPIYGKEIILEEDGHEEPNCKEKGNVIIYIEMAKEALYRRIHEYDLFTTIQIHPEDLHLTKISLKMPHGKEFNIEIPKDFWEEGRFGKILNEGLPNEEDVGDLYIYFDVTKKAERIVEKELKDTKTLQKYQIMELFDD
jgi:DnaJ-class molecular chaperone